jgi:hypothetical protein
LLVDTSLPAFQLPEDKATAFTALWQDMAAKPVLSNRDLARVAGKLISFAQAIDLAPLFARSVMKAMSGDMSWDELYPSPEALAADMRTVAACIQSRGPKLWHSSREVLRVAGDVSESQFAAHTINGALAHPIITYFSDAQCRAVHENEYSSTLREIEGITKTVLAILATSPHLVVGKLLVYETDSQPGWHAVMGMKGGPRTFPAVKELRLLCAEQDIELKVEWYPRERANQQLADSWSKHLDSSEWALNHEVTRDILAHPLLAGRSLTLDAFASTHTTKVEGVFYSRFHCVGTSGVDAFIHPWTLGTTTSHPRPLVWVNGPYEEMGAIISKILKERVDVILIRPEWPRGWKATLAQLPVVASMKLPHRTDMCIPGPVGKAQSVSLKYMLVAEFILW